VLAALLLTACGARGDQIGYEYNFVTPAAVTGDPGNLGAISFATMASGHVSSANATLTAATLAAATSAPASAPDTYHGQTYDLTLQLTDDASGKSGALTFAGKLFGTLSAQSANISTSFDNPGKSLVLGNDRYTVTLGPFNSSPNPTIVGTLMAAIQVDALAPTVTPAAQSPEPPALVLAGVGLCAAIGVALRRRSAERRPRADAGLLSC
jgi:hypothetical protein